MSKYRKEIGLFCAAFILTTCLLGMWVAFAAIEWNTQRMMHGHPTLGVSYTVEEGAPLLTDDEGAPLFSADERQQQGLWALLPPAARATLALLRGEAAALHRLWTWGEERLVPFLAEQLSFYKTDRTFV
ncbi:MAG: hypothetical protein IIW40_00320 [Clostridia bacterium]|nr:hypothetical protein [Clostridia bacterium]